MAQIVLIGSPALVMLDHLALVMLDRLALVMFDCFALASEHRRIGYLAAILKFVGPVY